MGTSNAADSSRDRTSADDDALGSSHPPETRQRERDEDDGLQRVCFHISNVVPLLTDTVGPKG